MMIEKTHKSAPSIFWNRCISAVLVTLLILLPACAQPTPVERAFSMQALLIDASVFPDGWEVSSGPRFVEWDHFSSTYGSWYVGFEVNTDSPRYTAWLQVYQYHNITIARRMYEKITTSSQHRGEGFSDDNCDGLRADQSQLTCESYQAHDQMNCNWTGLYDEYIVDFGTWLIPKRMSLEDVQKLICAIDAHVRPYFEQPPGDHDH